MIACGTKFMRFINNKGFNGYPLVAPVLKRYFIDGEDPEIEQRLQKGHYFNNQDKDYALAFADSKAQLTDFKAFTPYLPGVAVNKISIIDSVAYLCTTTGLRVGNHTASGISNIVTYTSANGLPSDVVNSIDVFDGVYYIGTDNGLCKTSDFITFTPITTKGFISKNVLGFFKEASLYVAVTPKGIVVSDNEVRWVTINIRDADLFDDHKTIQRFFKYNSEYYCVTNSGVFRINSLVIAPLFTKLRTLPNFTYSIGPTGTVSVSWDHIELEGSDIVYIFDEVAQTENTVLITDTGNYDFYAHDNLGGIPNSETFTLQVYGLDIERTVTWDLANKALATEQQILWTRVTTLGNSIVGFHIDASGTYYATPSDLYKIEGVETVKFHSTTPITGLFGTYPDFILMHQTGVTFVISEGLDSLEMNSTYGISGTLKHIALTPELVYLASNAGYFHPDSVVANYPYTIYPCKQTKKEEGKSPEFILERKAVSVYDYVVGVLREGPSRTKLKTMNDGSAATQTLIVVKSRSNAVTWSMIGAEPNKDNEFQGVMREFGIKP